MKPTYAAEGNRDTAQRIITAHAMFELLLVQMHDISAADAKAVSTLYLKRKLSKLDAVNGRISVKHGAFLDRDVVLRAVVMAKGEG